MDPRIARTRRSLQDALLSLAQDRDLDDITVTEIAAVAGVHRSTFSQHYPDKEALLADALDRFADVVDELPTDVESDDERVLLILRQYLTHIEEHAAVYSRVFVNHGSSLAAARVRERIELIVYRGLEGKPIAAGAMPIDVVAAGIAGSAIGVVARWLGHVPRESVDVVATWTWQLLIGQLAMLEQLEQPAH